MCASATYRVYAGFQLFLSDFQFDVQLFFMVCPHCVRRVSALHSHHLLYTATRPDVVLGSVADGEGEGGAGGSDTIGGLRGHATYFYLLVPVQPYLHARDQFQISFTLRTTAGRSRYTRDNGHKAENLSMLT